MKLERALSVPDEFNCPITMVCKSKKEKDGRFRRERAEGEVCLCLVSESFCVCVCVCVVCGALGATGRVLLFHHHVSYESWGGGEGLVSVSAHLHTDTRTLLRTCYTCYSTCAAPLRVFWQRGAHSLGLLSRALGCDLFYRCSWSGFQQKGFPVINFEMAVETGDLR
jgi:hypothetical protein